MIYFLLLPASLAMTLLAYVLAPVLPLFSMRGWLVRELWWFQTPDNSLYGDQGHEERWGFAHSYAQMVAWLFRNPAYGFEWNGPLAASITRDDHLTDLSGDPWIKNRANAKAGSYLCRVGDYWNYKLIKPIFGDTALMAEFGWKLQGYAQGREVEGKAMYVCSIRFTAFNP